MGKCHSGVHCCLVEAKQKCTYLCFLIVYTWQWDLNFSQQSVGVSHIQTAPTFRSKSMSWEELTGSYWGNIARDILHAGPPVPPWLLASWEPKLKSVFNGWLRLKLSLKKMIYWVTDWGLAWKDFHLWGVLVGLSYHQDAVSWAPETLSLSLFLEEKMLLYLLIFNYSMLGLQARNEQWMSKHIYSKQIRIVLCMFQCLLSSDNGKWLDEKGGIFFFR